MSPRLFLLVLLLLGAHALAEAQSGALVVLDPGHVPSSPGAIGSCGSREVDLNDAASAAVRAALEQDTRIRVELTRDPGSQVKNLDLTPSPPLPPSGQAGREPPESLYRRADIANVLGARLFIALHHDSAEDSAHVFDPAICDGRGGTRMSDAFLAAHHVGYNVWVYQGDPSNAARFAESVRVATAIGKRLRAAGLVPSDFHAKPVSDCDSCRAIDLENGVWNQNLAVLKRTQMPAILIEAQNIDEPGHEALAQTPAFRALLGMAVSGGVEEYLSHSPPRR